MSNDLVCPICGETTSSYMGNFRKDRLCKKHSIDMKNGKLVKCEKCLEWHYVDKPCKCTQPANKTLPKEEFSECIVCGASTKNGYAFCFDCYSKYSDEERLKIFKEKVSAKRKDKVDDSKAIAQPPPVQATAEKSNTATQNKVVVIDHDNKAKCITCGKKTDGLLFCATCYHKYKSKELLFRITNCSNVELLDEDYEGRYTCKDGHIVKSKSERDIDNYLYEHGISHAYERELPYGATSKDILHPDFYLPNYLGDGKSIYIEHWGYNENNIQYTKTKKFKMPIYQNLKITLICTYEKTDMGKIDTVLDRKLNKQFIKENQINYEDTTTEV